MEDTTTKKLDFKKRSIPKGKRLPRTLTLTLFSIALILFFSYGCQNKDKSKIAKNTYKDLFKKKGQYTQAKLPYQTLARINIESISEPLFELFLAAKKQSNPGYKTKRDEATTELIDIFLLAQKARQENLHKIRKVKEQLRFQKISLLAKLYLNNLKASIIISEQEMEIAHRKRYLLRDNHEYKTRHIVVKDRKKAVSIMRKLLNNENFSSLAHKYSTAPSSSFGGALEWFRPDSVSRKFSAAVQKLSKGETSRFPLKTKHGYHIILLEDIRKVSPPTLKQVYARLREDLIQKKIEKHIKKLRDFSTITINQTRH